MSQYGQPAQFSSPRRVQAPVDPSLRGLAHRVERSKVKVATLIKQCEDLDVNRDGIVHISDLEDVLINMLGAEGVSKREMQHLSRVLQAPGYQDGSIEYRKLHDALDTSTPDSKPSASAPLERSKASKEHWYDPSDILDRRAQLKKGSVGDWLQRASCPAEIGNFKTFIQLLEDYERVTGLKCVPTERGFSVPLGPDLKATINFSLS
ncbi:hypothetical protein EON64_05920 [archaeon]|nr:MAG: hypothetical protein EON64_05920 [archaeon]